MKTTVFILAIVSFATAAPQRSKLNFHNLFKNPIEEIKTKPSPRIIGGQEAEPHSIPYQVFVEIYSEFGGWYCGGSLISENYILTAGRCSYMGAEAHITLGAHKPFEDEETQVKIVSKDMIIHEDFDSYNLLNDIAVIKLPEPVKLTDVIGLVTLPSKSDVNNTYENSTARLSGWGVTDGFNEVNQTLSDVLNYVDLEIISNDECANVFHDLPESNICTSGKNHSGSCMGDHGDPLVANGIQVGIVSFYVHYCYPGFPSGFTRVTSFLDWIENNTDIKIQ